MKVYRFHSAWAMDRFVRMHDDCADWYEWDWERGEWVPYFV